MAGVKALVHHRVVVNHSENQTLLGDKDFLLALLYEFERGRLELEPRLREVGTRVAVDRIVKVVLFKGISEGAAATMRIGQLAGIGYLPQSLSHKTLSIRQDRLAIGRIVLLVGIAHASPFFATAVLPQ